MLDIACLRLLILYQPYLFNGYSRIVSGNLSGKKSVTGRKIAGILKKMRVKRQCAEGIDYQKCKILYCSI